MAFCPQCGKAVKEIEKFCANCGENLKEFFEDIEEEAEEKVRKTSNKGLIVFILFLIIAGYVVLDIWAATQIQPEISLDSLWTTASNLKGDVGTTSASGSTKFRLENPTFVPVFLFPIKYEFGYGSTTIAEGSSGIIFIAPYSSNDVSADIELSYVGAGSAALKGIWNTITGNDEDLYADFYELGIKFASVRK
jgi:hypothetical protein